MEFITHELQHDRQCINDVLPPEIIEMILSFTEIRCIIVRVCKDWYALAPRPKPRPDYTVVKSWHFYKYKRPKTLPGEPVCINSMIKSDQIMSYIFNYVDNPYLIRSVCRHWHDSVSITEENALGIRTLKKDKLCEYAVRKGYMLMYCWAMEYQCCWMTCDSCKRLLRKCCEYVARGGQIGWVKALTNRIQKTSHPFTASDARTICRIAAASGQLELLVQLRKAGWQWNRWTAAYAAYSGQLITLKWMVENDCPLGPAVCEYAVAGGHTSVLSYLMEINCPYDEWTYMEAIRYGRIEMLILLQPHDCLKDYKVCIEAARRGHVGVLAWLRSIGSPWDDRVCFEAAKYGHLNVLEWACKNSCPWDGRIVGISRIMSDSDTRVKHPRKTQRTDIACYPGVATWLVARAQSYAKDRFNLITEWESKQKALHNRLEAHRVRLAIDVVALVRNMWKRDQEHREACLNRSGVDWLMYRTNMLRKATAPIFNKKTRESTPDTIYLWHLSVTWNYNLNMLYSRVTNEMPG